ncbi:MAG: hypothetical protein NWF10_02570 [Candidatus Bathyarchaeota archaeon]|nr:hypothetical protein [Candidatus Bathyarchaeota archaeon]
MPITQVSVFLDNRPGSLSEAMNQLDKNQIEIFALSIADAGEFGLVRMITENPQKTTEILEENDFNLAKSKKNTQVTATFISEKNKISKITKILAQKNLNIDYAYSSAVHIDGKVALILRIDKVEEAEDLLSKNGVEILKLDEIKKYFQ